MKAVILAGGKGTRLSEKTESIPKPMLHIGSKPLLEHQVNLLVENGIHEICILVNYLKEHIQDYFGNGRRWNADITYYEEKEPLGTVGGIKAIEDWLDQDFVVFYGDVMINMDVLRLLNFHKKKESVCTLVVHPNNHPYDSDLIEFDTHDKIIKVLPKNKPRDRFYLNMVNAGAYVFSPKILNHIKFEKADFGRDIFPELYKKIDMYAYNTAEYLKDMGTPDRLEEVNHDFDTGKIARLHHSQKRRAVFLDRDGVINKEVSFIFTPEQLELYPFTAEAIKRINDTEFLSIVVTNQSAVARNLCNEEELALVHNKMHTELGQQHAKIDALYYCPHHPDGGYPEERKELKIECDCRKPKPGMLLNAAKDFNIDLNNSYLIGDTDRDILAGRNAGCKTIGVRTGYGLKESQVKPNYMFNDLAEAVDFIVNDPLEKHYANIGWHVDKKEGEPFVILVGGNARSGKTTLASYLEDQFSELYEVQRISLDDWILDLDKRQESHNVYDRFQLLKIEQELSSMIEPKLVIIEGVVALSSEKLRSISNLKIFVQANEKLRQNRLKAHYRWKGMRDERIEDLLSSRASDEYDLIAQEIKYADIVVNN